MTEQQSAGPQVMPDVVYNGKQIILPSGMDIPTAIGWLKKKHVQENTEVAISEEIDALPYDGALAFAKAIARTYGFSQPIPTPGFWGSKNPPEFIAIPISHNQTVQVPWGRMEIPTISGYVETGVNRRGNSWYFQISGTTLLKHKEEIAALARLTRQIVREESIYRAKAIRVAFLQSQPDRSGKLQDVLVEMPEPSFMDLSGVRPEELVFAKDTGRLIQYALFTPIEHTESCRSAKVPLKRGVLLSGPYGCGKTLTANVTAKKAVENGWTFVYLSSVRELAQAIAFAQRFQPCIVFAEDIDTVLEHRDDAVNAILNTIDGVDTKHNELIVVLTTNHVERIHPAMLRPGRLDAVVNIEPPDSQAVEHLIYQYGRGLVTPEADLTMVGQKLAGNLPAMIRECVERAKLAAISHTNPGDPLILLGSDLEIAADTMMHHLKLIMPTPPDTRSDSEKAAGVIADSILRTAVLFDSQAAAWGDKDEKDQHREYRERLRSSVVGPRADRPATGGNGI